MLRLYAAHYFSALFFIVDRHTPQGNLKAMTTVSILLRKEQMRQRTTINLIASENIPSPAVLKALASPLSAKYAEGTIGARYYAGCQVVDEIEALAQQKVKELFVPADQHAQYHVNVQPISGSNANLAAYLALVKPGETILSMSLAAGGHLSHGHASSLASKLFNVHQYGVIHKTEMIDYENLRTLAHGYKPKLIIAGGSAYPRTLDFAAFRAIADEVGAFLLIDMAHIAGLVATGFHPSPVPYADVITSTTHKTLRGPRGAFILSKASLGTAIDRAVMPGLQGGPNPAVFAAQAIALEEAQNPLFSSYQQTVLACTKKLASELIARRFSLVTGGTDTHLLIIHLGKSGLLPLVTGRIAEERLEQVGIITNRNSVPFEAKSPRHCSGLRIGLPALVSRGAQVGHMPLLAELITDAMHEKNTEETTKRVRAFARSLST